MDFVPDYVVETIADIIKAYEDEEEKEEEIKGWKLDRDRYTAKAVPVLRNLDISVKIDIVTCT